MIKVDNLNNFERSTMKSLIQDYRPNKIIDSPVSMKMILDDDYPVYSLPRRTSYAKNCIIEQVGKVTVERVRK